MAQYKLGVGRGRHKPKWNKPGVSTVAHGVDIEHEDDYWLVTSPWDEDFITWAKEKGARWRPDERAWAFSDSDFTRPELEKELKVFYPGAFR